MLRWIVLLLYLFSGALFAQPSSLGEALEQNQWKISEFNQLKIDQYYVGKHAGIESRRIVASDREVNIQMDIDSPISEKVFEEYAQLHQKQFLTIFTKSDFILPPKFKKKMECPFSLFPSKHSIVLFQKYPADFFRTNVNERFKWGICDVKQIKGVAYWGIFLHPPSSSLIYLKMVFLHKDQEERFKLFVRNLQRMGQ